MLIVRRQTKRISCMLMLVKCTTTVREESLHHVPDNDSDIKLTMSSGHMALVLELSLFLSTEIFLTRILIFLLPIYPSLFSCL